MYMIWRRSEKTMKLEYSIDGGSSASVPAGLTWLEEL